MVLRLLRYFQVFWEIYEGIFTECESQEIHFIPTQDSEFIWMIRKDLHEYHKAIQNK